MSRRSLFTIIFCAVIFCSPFAAHAWSVHSFDQNLSRGTTSADVSFLQQYLAGQGYFSASTTGYFGKITFASVKAWQLANNIPSTGFFGPISRAFVNTTPIPSSTFTSTSVANNLPTQTLSPTISASSTSTFCAHGCGGVTITPGSNIQQTVPTPPAALVGYWPLDEGTGTVALDSTGNGLNGSWNGTKSSPNGTYYSSIVAAGAAAGYFNGTNNFIDMGNSTLFDTQGASLAAWVYPTAFSYQNIIMGKEFQYKMTIDSGQFTILSSCLGDDGWDVDASVATATLNEWSHVAFVQNAASATDQFYLNGALVYSTSSCGAVNVFTNNDFEIGAYNSSTAPFQGFIDDARFYSGALTADEVEALYTANTPSRSLVIAPTSTTLLSGATTTFLGTFYNDPGDQIMWSATAGSIDPVTGAYIAPTVLSTTTVTITAQSSIIEAINATATVTVSSGLLGLWPTNEGSGSTAFDSSGNGYNGTWNGVGAGDHGFYQSYGVFEYAGAFDGSTNYVSTPVSWPTSGSISIWAAPLSLNAWASPAGWKYAPSSGGYILIDEGGSGNWRAVFNSSAGSEADVQSTSTIPTSAWSYLTMTWNKIGATTTVSLYVNAVLRGSTTTAQSVTPNIGSFYYGTAGQSANNDFNGSIDDVRVYDRALSPTEIQGIYTAEKTVNSSVPFFLVGS
jgi:peptidoglycan hydrolase-like protein with peptidoglycan-binding domain